MPITWSTVFKCDRCGTESSVVQDVTMYDDPVVAPPRGEGWDYVGDLLLCPECLSK